MDDHGNFSLSRICLGLAVLFVYVALILGGLQLLAACNSGAPTQSQDEPMMRNVPYDLDGIRTNGSESDATHPPQITWRAFHPKGNKLIGPSPNGNFWTRAAAEAAYNRAKNGQK